MTFTKKPNRTNQKPTNIKENQYFSAENLKHTMTFKKKPMKNQKKNKKH